jgi:peptide-methionine (S)-S-oxide reductase
MKVIYLGAGTFWLTEAIYKGVKGVTEVVPGYMGGEFPNPTSEIVSTGSTGHAEVVQITYDEQVVSTEDLLNIFYAMHDPAIPQHPAHGVGSQYRPVIFYTDEAEGEAADNQNGDDVGLIPRVVQKVQQTLPEDVVISTHIMTAKEFYPAEEYHYDYFFRNPSAPFSIEVIIPTLESVHQKLPQYF